MKAPDWHLNPRVKEGEEPATAPVAPKVPAPRARYDAARTGPENREHWKHADALSANAAANARDRWILRQRARYEVANNSFANGAANSLADDAIGTGPRLQLILDDIDEEKVRAVENLWQAWCDETRLGDTLRLLYRAQCVDGEGVALAVDNPRLDHPVKLQLRELECDRLTDPGGISLTIVSMNPGRVDGIHFDSAGNPTRYTILRHHPGDLLAMPLAEWDEYPASQVYHLFRADRPGQARGVSWLTPALPLFAQLRRYTLAVISAAETAANIAGVLHTTAPATGEGDAPIIETLDQVPIPRNALLTLPNEWQATSFQGDQPQQTFGDFRTQILVEIGRALDMPLNRITGNSSGYNYSSGRLDHLGYQRGVWQQRDRLRLIILDRLFRAWYDEALLAGAIPSGLPPMSEWAWDWQWDAFGDIDPSKEAKAAGQLLSLNLTDLAEQCAARGRRWDQVLRQRAREMDLMEELGLPMPTDKAAEAPAQGQTLEEMAAAAKMSLVPLACGGEGSGVPGPCPGGGEGEKTEKEQKTYDKEHEKNEKAANDAVESHNKIYGRAVASREKPASPVFHGEHRAGVEKDVEQSLSKDGKRPVSKVYFENKVTAITDHYVNGQLRGSVEQSKGKDKAGPVKVTDGSSGGRSRTIKEDDSKEERAKKIDYALRKKPDQAIHSLDRFLACGGEGSGVPGPCPGGGEGEDKSGGGRTETHDKWDREDVDQEAERDDRIGEAQDRYDAVEEKIADKEESGNEKIATRQERENDKVDRAQEKEDRGVERERNKEDRQDDRNDRATEKANEQQRAQELDDAEKAGASDGDMEKIGEKWDAKGADDLDRANAREDAKEASREKEDTDRADAREKEAAQREARHEAEQKEHASKIEQERAANESRHAKETAEIERQFEKDKADSQAQREKDNPDAAREYYKKDKAGANAPRRLAPRQVTRAVLRPRACGGEGSGVPGPCPAGGEEEKAKEEKGKEELKEHTRPNKSLPDESRPPLSQAEAKAVKDYTDPTTKTYYEINKSLREGKEPEGKHAETNKELQSAMAKTKEFKEPVTAYRGMYFGSQDRQDQFAAKVEAAKKDGNALEFAGYSSTSTSRKEVEAVFSKDKKSALIEIEAKKGLDVKSFSKTPSERELLLDRSSKFEVVSSEKVDGQLRIKLRQIVTPSAAPKGLTWLQVRSQAAGGTDESRFVDNGDDHVTIVEASAPRRLAHV